MQTKLAQTRKLTKSERDLLGAFVQRTFKLTVGVMFWKILVSTERSCHKEYTCVV